MSLPLWKTNNAISSATEWALIPGFSGTVFSWTGGWGSSLHVFPSSSNPSCALKVPAQPTKMHPGDFMVAVSHMASSLTPAVSSQIPLSTRSSFPIWGFFRLSHTPETHTRVTGLTFSNRVSNVLQNARKPATRWSCQSKWNKYLTYLTLFSLSIQDSYLCSVFDFLLHLKDTGLRHSSMKVYLSAISAYHRLVEGKTMFSHPLSKQFLHGLWNLHLRLPPACLGLDAGSSSSYKASFWIHGYMRPPMVFLVAITSARRLSELPALHCGSPSLLGQLRNIQCIYSLTFIFFFFA